MFMVNNLQRSQRLGDGNLSARKYKGAYPPEGQHTVTSRT